MADNLDITDSTVNAFKLHILLVNGGTAALRRLFNGYVPDLISFLNSKEAEIRTLVRKKILTKSQWDKLYPAVGIPSSETFDISLLCALLRNPCNLAAPCTGRGTKPAAEDHSVEGAVEMIHWYRNNLYGHSSSMNVAESSFESSWKEISKAVERLGEDLTHIENLRGTQLCVTACVERLAKCEFSSDIAFHASRYYPGTREWVFSHVNKWFVNRSSVSRVLIIAGSAGMGKSVIAGELCQRMKQRNLLGGVHFCQFKDQRRTKPKLMLQSLARHLCDNLPGFKEILTGQLTSVSASAIAAMNVQELFTFLLQEPTNMTVDPGTNILLLVDALDECKYDGRNELMDVIAWHFHKLPTWIKFLVTGRTEKEMEQRLQTLQPFVLFPLDDKNQRDIEMFFDGELKPFLPSSDFEKSIRRFVDQAQGLMLYAYYVIEFIKEHKQTLTSKDIEGIFPRGISSVYEQYFNRLEAEVGASQERFSNFLSALAAARAPLPVTMAASILNLRSDSRGRVWEVAERAIGSISRLLPIHDSCIRVFHKSIIDWLTCPELYGRHRFTVDLKRGNAVVSEECDRTYRTMENRSDFFTDFTPDENYALQQGTFHSIAGLPDLDESQINKVFRHATSLRLLHAKLSSTVCDVYTIIEELQLLKRNLNFPKEDVLELDDCLNCLRRHVHVLTENPNTIFQLLANEAQTVALSLEACKLMHLPKYGSRCRLEVVNRSEWKDPVVTKFRCKSNVNCCAVFRGTHSLLVCGCSGGFIQMFSLETGRELWWAKEHEVDAWPDEERCNYCVFIPHLSVVLHGRFDKAFSFDGELKNLFLNNHHTFIDSCLSPDRKRLLTRQCHVTNELILWDINTGNQLTCLSQSSGSITCCVFSSCGQFIVSGSLDLGISIWDTRKFSEHPKHRSSDYAGHPLNVNCLAGREGNSQFILVNVSKKQSFTVCEMQQGALNPCSSIQVNLHPGHRALGVSVDGSHLFVCGHSRQILSYTSVPFSVRTVQVSEATSLEYATDVDSERVLLKSSDTIYLCQTVQNTSLASAPNRDIRAISFSIDGSRVYVLSKIGLSIYEALSGRLVVCNTSIIDGKHFSLSPSGEQILVRRRAKDTRDYFEVWDSYLERQIQTIDITVESQDIFKHIDNNHLLLFSRNGFVKVWNMSTRELESITRLHHSRIECVDVFPIKREENDFVVKHCRVVSCDSLGSLTRYDTTADHPVTRNVPLSKLPKCCRFSPDGSAIVTGHLDGSTRTWDSQSLEFKRAFPGPQIAAVVGCGFLVQDLGCVVVSGTKDGYLRVWDGFSREELSSIDFENELRAVATSSVKGQICMAFADNIVILNAHVPELE